MYKIYIFLLKNIYEYLNYNHLKKIFYSNPELS